MITPLVLLLALAPSPSPPAFEIADADLEASPNSSHLLAYDSDGEVTAELIVWIDPAGSLHFDAVFPDGLYSSTSISDGKISSESNDAGEVAARMGVIDDWLAETRPQGKWVPCAVGVVGTVLGVVNVNPWAIVTAVSAACTCLPLLIEEWEEMACPGFG